VVQLLVTIVKSSTKVVCRNTFAWQTEMYFGICIIVLKRVNEQLATTIYSTKMRNCTSPIYRYLSARCRRCSAAS